MSKVKSQNCKEPSKSPWVGKWRAFYEKESEFVAIVKQSSKLKGPCFDTKTRETGWVLISLNGGPKYDCDKQVYFFPVGKDTSTAYAVINFEDLPLPPVEYLMDQTYTEFELTENSYILYD